MEEKELIIKKVISFDGIQDTYDQVIVRERKPRLLRRILEKHLDKKKE